MLIFNFAGHDTITNTISYAIALMATYPEIQEWVAQEVRAVLSTTEKSHYDLLFLRLKRVRALIYEKLRLYPPFIDLPNLMGSRLMFFPQRKYGSHSSKRNHDPRKYLFCSQSDATAYLNRISDPVVGSVSLRPRNRFPPESHIRMRH